MLGAYLFPAEVGIGKFQILGKFGTTTFEDNVPPISPVEVDQDTMEINVNYIIKAFNARISSFYIDVDVGATGPTTVGHHAMLKFPDEPGSGVISTSRFVYGQVFPEPVERPDSRGHRGRHRRRGDLPLRRYPQDAVPKRV